MTVADVMNKEPLVLEEERSVDDAIRAFTEHHKVDPIPVINSEKKPIGVISRFDMVKLFSEYGVSFASDGSEATKPKSKNSNKVFWIGLVILALATGIIYYLFF